MYDLYLHVFHLLFHSYLIFLLKIHITDHSSQHRAMEQGSKPWSRGQVMLVGDLGVGKTALCNSMLGKPFLETESTIGLTHLTCDVWRAVGAGVGRWTERPLNCEKKCETYATRVIKEMESQQLQKKLSSREEKSSGQQVPPARRGNTQAFERLDNNRVTTLIEQEVTTRRDHKRFRPCDPDVAAKSKEIRLDTAYTGHSIVESALKKDSHAGPTVSSSNNKLHISRTNSELLIENLADVTVPGNNASGSNLNLSIFEIGGEYAFNIIHHLFLTSYRVYVVVFNMVDVLDVNKKDKCLIEMSFWINSIVMHTRGSEFRETFHVFLAGTHKDIVSDIAEHEYISNEIKERFRQNFVWSSVEPNSNLSFFPVNNLNCQRDPVVMDMMSKIEKSIFDDVNNANPLTWLNVLDEFEAAKKNFLTLDEASSIAKVNGVKEEEVRYLLKFLNEMGVVLWLDEDGLRDVVILDPVTFFVEPALVLCNNVIYNKNIQDVAKQHQSEWEELSERGVVARELINILWEDHVVASDMQVIILIMLKFGLIVRLKSTQESSQSTEKYLVPALLPPTKNDPRTYMDDIWNDLMHFESCYFVFSTASNFCRYEALTPKQLKEECFLSKGLMERLIVKWCNLTDVAIIQRYSNYTELYYGSQMFRLVYISELNCIRLDVEGFHPLPLYNRVNKLIDLCVKECMGSLQYMTALQFSELKETFILLNLTSVRGVRNNEKLMVNGRLVELDCINSMYSSWLTKKKALPSYDIFISHRWNNDDNKEIEKLCGKVRNQAVGPGKRAVSNSRKIFLDKDILEKSQQFQREYGNALANSTIIVPVLSTAALQKMIKHNPAEEDNVLIEWMLALECLQDPTHSKLRAVYPLFLGEKDYDEFAGFTEGVIQSLLQTEPRASVEVVRTLLKENGLTESSSLSKCTVHSVLQEIWKCLGDDRAGNFLSEEASDKIIIKLDEGKQMHILNIMYYTIS